MTKPCLLRSWVGRHHRANFDVAIRDNDTINQQLDQLPFLRKRRRAQSVPHPSAEVLDATSQPGEFLAAIGLRLQLSLLLGESLGAAFQVLPAAILLQRDDTALLQSFIPEALRCCLA
jgi:hypothetical protein